MYAGKVVLVTGAGSGIGRACARAFAREGAVLALVARNADAIRELAEKHGGTAHPCDLMDRDAVVGLVDRVESEAGPIDASVLKVLRYIQQEPYEEAARVRLTPELAAGLERVMHELMRAMAERDLGSARFISEVRQTPRTAAANEDSGGSAAVAASAEPPHAYTEPDSLNA